MPRLKYKLAPLAIYIAMGSIHCYAENVFNPAFLSDDPSAVADLSHFDEGGQAPGIYRVDVWVNEEFITTKDIQFISAKSDEQSNDDTGLEPCLTVKTLGVFGVNTTAKPDLAATAPDTCVHLASAIEGALTQFDFDQQRLDLSVPQAMMSTTARGYIPPAQWDEGINALLFNYNFSGANSSDRENDSASNTYFLGLNSGFNLGPWRLRDYSTWSYSSGQRRQNSQWNHINTYLERAIIPLKSELTIGDSSTPSEVFDSISFRGIQIASDDNMLPDSLRGFAPTVRGIAKSHAQVTVRQNGYIIYQTYVSPGAFEIKDLFPTSSSGDLVVEVKESDGSVNIYREPYSTVPILQREGRIKYSATAGTFRSNNDQQDNPGFAQSTVIWGLPKGFTAYGGGQLANRYKAAVLGLGLNIGRFGAVSMDVTGADSELVDGTKHVGSSLRFLYAKSLGALGTNFQLLGYRYSTQGFYTLEETTWNNMSGYVSDETINDGTAKPEYISAYNLYNNKRDKFQVNISQQLGAIGSLYLSGSRQSYWNTNKASMLLQTGYSGNVLGVSWNLNYSYNKMPGLAHADNRIAMSVSVPLSLWFSQGNDALQRNNSAYASYSASNDMHGHTTQSAGINGTLLEDNNLNYSVQQGYQNQNSSANGSVSADYASSWGNVNGGYNYSDNGNYQQVNYGLSGGVVIHDQGITLSQPLGQTNVLIAAPGARNVKVEDVSGLKTDWRGYAVVPYATTYRRNKMALDTTSMPDNVDMVDSVVSVVPTRGALVRASFDTQVGARVLINLTHQGKPVPFGAMVSSGDNSSIVGDDGQVYLSGLKPKGSLTVKWGDGAMRTCSVDYTLPDDAETKPINILTRECKS